MSFFMKPRYIHMIAASMLIWLLAGCSGKKAVVKQDPPQPEAVVTAPAAKPVPRPLPPEPPSKLLNAVAAIVNNEIITLYEVQREAASQIRERERKAPLDVATRSKMTKAALESLIDRTLVRQKIRELGIGVSDEEVRQSIEDVKKQNNMSQGELVSALATQGLTYEQYFKQLKDQLEKLKLVSMEVKSKIHVAESEMREYYDAHHGDYSEEDVFHARHIFFRTSENAPPEQIKTTMSKALLVMSEARTGKDFAELAKKYSEDPAARNNGGDLGSFKKGEMQAELEQAIISLQPGEVSELVYTSLGLHIIKLEERIKGKLKPFENVKASIEELLYRNKSEERFNRWAKEMRTNSSVEVMDLKGAL